MQTVSFFLTENPISICEVTAEHMSQEDGKRQVKIRGNCAKARESRCLHVDHVCEVLKQYQGFYPNQVTGISSSTLLEAAAHGDYEAYRDLLIHFGVHECIDGRK